MKRGMDFFDRTTGRNRDMAIILTDESIVAQDVASWVGENLTSRHIVIVSFRAC